MVGKDTTHLVVMLREGQLWSPRQLLGAVVQQAGGSSAATALGAGLQARRLQLVTTRQASPEILQQCIAATHPCILLSCPPGASVLG